MNMMIVDRNGLGVELKDWFDGRAFSVQIDGSDIGVTGLIPFADVHGRDRVIITKPLSQIPLKDPKKLTDLAKGMQVMHTCLGTNPPDIDRSAFDNLFKDQNPAILIVDTGALAEGIVTWLVRILWNRHIDIVINSVAEREIFGWADQDDFWSKKDPSAWQLRVKYRCARQVSETPILQSMPYHPIPDEKAALMLAKLKTPGQKSPDADLLLIEQARSVMRDRNPRSNAFYVTPDRNHARSAVSLLAPQNVLYAMPKPVDSQLPIRGSMAFWQPATALGSMRLLSPSEFVLTLMLGTRKVVFAKDNNIVEIEYVVHGSGTPTDWANPSFIIRNITNIQAIAVSESPIDIVTPPVGSGDSQDYLLPPINLSDQKITSAYRPSPSVLLSYFNILLKGEKITFSDPKRELENEVFKLLIALEVIDFNATAQSNSVILEAIRNNNWDVVHAHFKRLTGYQKALSIIEKGKHPELTRRDQEQISFARKIGQVAKLSKVEPVLIGDHPLMERQLVDFLESVMPDIGRDYSVMQICRLALETISVSPSRLEIALQKLFQQGYACISTETGGTSHRIGLERVWNYNGVEIQELERSIDAFYFGGDRPIRQLRRIV